jgi:non-specific serine/threonine protein kinase
VGIVANRVAVIALMVLIKVRATFDKTNKPTNQDIKLMTFHEQILEGIPKVLPQPKPYDPAINHAPKRKEILNEEEKFPNHSIKLDELTREIQENIGEHKALVFSQFLGMLALIREKLSEAGIAYEYFDGSTSSPERQRAIDNFQSNDSCRVFLISLKAGGVGLNLTAADYVYIVDPWWNPAVEQQAIDRTHRIGQTKNIFAYRMICIDTIEDKILQLQERKRKLASELITDDASFVKALTRADVEYLFS